MPRIIDLSAKDQKDGFTPPDKKNNKVIVRVRYQDLVPECL